ncbi:SLC13 family permease [Pontibacterium granulatum]|uniref:SLC13 family permease n=1 Tax=Pontibacterium granulatum TaxID=2036029 RepID=UPI00249C7C9F|nr:SLC13 family permease [Pontibacterium granulatum]MDI3326687.1 SLC13 family permease [Pontibacterium granulatum]
MPKLITAILTLLCGLLLIILQPAGLTLQQATGAALVLFAILFWAMAILPDYLTALIFMLAAILFSVAPPEVVFAGFSSAAMWLIFSGLVFGMAINSTGLGQRIAGALSHQVNGSYVRLISGIVIASVLVGFVMPSSLGRAVLLIPIVMALADSCGFKPGSKGRTGTALAGALGCHVPTFAVLPANVPNMVFIGAAETIHGVTPGYSEYLFLHFPVLGFLKAVLIIGLILLLFPDTPQHQPAQTTQTSGNGGQRKLILVLGTALAFWFTDSIHHISPAWVGLTAALFLLMPGVGLVDGKTFNDKMNFSLMVFLAGILALGTVINTTGLGGVLANTFNTWVPLNPDNPALNFASLSGSAILTALVATLPGVPAVLTPFADQMADKSGMTLEAVLMTQVLGFSTILMPYQSAPLVVAMQLAKEPLRHAIRFCLISGALTILILLPLDYLWWQWLGWI